MEVFDVCPLLIPQNREATVYEGFLTAKESNFYLHIHIPESDIKKATVQCEWHLSNLLKGYSTILQHRLNNSTSLASFLVELKEIVEKLLDSGKHSLYNSKSFNLNKEFIDQVESLGWNKLVYADPSFQRIHLCAYDSYKRKHIIEISLPKNYPESMPRWGTSLPEPFQMPWAAKTTLCCLYEEFCKCIEKYELFWNEMDDLDANTWILEPDKPSRVANYRRIALGNNGSIKVVINPTQPTEWPEYYFFGPEHFVNPLKVNMAKNVEKWDNETGIRTNLETVLEMSLPSPLNTEKTEYKVDCSICYSYYLGSSTPDIACNNKQCGQPFHQDCLYEWLRGLSTSRQSFNTMFGECPYCNMPVTVKVIAK